MTPHLDALHVRNTRLLRMRTDAFEEPREHYELMSVKTRERFAARGNIVYDPLRAVARSLTETEAERLHGLPLGFTHTRGIAKHHRRGLLARMVTRQWAVHVLRCSAERKQRAQCAGQPRAPGPQASGTV